jgi:hypothetical protein
VLFEAGDFTVSCDTRLLEKVPERKRYVRASTAASPVFDELYKIPLPESKEKVAG